MSNIPDEGWLGSGRRARSQPFMLRRNGYWAVAAMFLLNGGLFGVWASRIPSFVERFQISPDHLGLLLLGMATGGIASFSVAGRLSDRHGAGVITRRIAVLYMVSLSLIGPASSVLTLALAIVVFGAMQGALDVAMNAWGAEVECQLERPVMSSLHAMFSLGAGLGAASGYLAVQYGIGTGPHFLGVGLLLGVGALTVSAGRWPSATPIGTELSGGLILPRGPLALVGLIAACASLSEGAMADWSGVFLHSVTGLSEAQSTLGYAAFSAAMFVMRLLGDPIVRRWGPSRSAQVSGAMAASGVLLAVSGGSAGVVLTGFALMGLGFANIAPLAFSRAGSDPDLPPGAAIAGVATFGYGGLLLGPVVIGWISGATSLVAGFGILAGLALVISLLGNHLKLPGSKSVESRTNRPLK